MSDTAPRARERRSSMFFNGDVSSAAEELAHRLADDYDLTEGQTFNLARQIESAIHNSWPDR